MKLVHMASGLAVAIALATAQIKARIFRRQPRLQIRLFQRLQQPAIQQPECLRYRLDPSEIALPPDAVLTVTLSDASLADAPSKCWRESGAY